MSTQQLIYETVVPLSKARHAEWCIEAGRDFSHSKSLQFVPVLAAEFVAAAREFPIVFSKGDDGIQPLALLGMRKAENLYVTESGKWSATYVPAFLRRYPFIFSRSEDGSTFTLCIDESFAGFNQDGKGERLFTDESKPTTYVDNILKFLQTFQVQHARSQAFCGKLDEFDLFEPHNAVWTGPDGEKATLTGFHCLNRARLNDLPPKVLAGMVKNGELELVYAHLLSLANFNEMKRKLADSTRDSSTKA